MNPPAKSLSHIAAINEHRRLIREFADALQALQRNPCDYTRKRLKQVSQTIQDLKRQNEIVELNRKVF